MLQRSSPLSGLPRSARREIEFLMATDPDCGSEVEQEILALDASADLDDQISRKQMLDIGFARLSARQERVLRLRYGLGGVGCHTLREIADQFGLTAESVRTIELAARSRMIKHWNHHGLCRPAGTRQNTRRTAQPSKPTVCLASKNATETSAGHCRPADRSNRPTNDWRASPLPSPIPNAPIGKEVHILQSGQRDLPADLSTSRPRPKPGILSRIWDWVPWGRVAHSEFYLDRLFSNRRR